MNKGFTLIETLVAIVVFALAMGGAAMAIMGVYRSQSRNRKQAVAIEEARRGIKTMVKEIRESQPREGGSYPLEKAGGKELIFYSDVDQDLKVEKVRYYLGSVKTGSEIKTCYSSEDGGSCQVTFSNLLTGELDEVSLKVTVEGDLNKSENAFFGLPEYLEISSNGWSDQICEGEDECEQCKGFWGDTGTIYESDELFNLVKNNLNDNNQISFTADASEGVESKCDWRVGEHSFQVQFTLNWTETVSQGDTLKKTVTEPEGSKYTGTTTTEIVSSHVDSNPPIFKYYYFDKNSNELKKIEEKPARLKDTELMRVSLKIDEDPERKPEAFKLSSYAQLRNRK